MTLKRVVPTGLVPALCVLAALAGPATSPAAAEEMALDNGRVRAEFNDAGLSPSPRPKRAGGSPFRGPVFDNDRRRPRLIDGLGPAEIEMTPAKVAYRYTRDPYTFDVVYELKPTWDFVSKQIVVTSARSRVFRINEVKPFASTLGLRVYEELKLRAARSASSAGSRPRTPPPDRHGASTSCSRTPL